MYVSLHVVIRIYFIVVFFFTFFWLTLSLSDIRIIYADMVHSDSKKCSGIHSNERITLDPYWHFLSENHR